MSALNLKTSQRQGLLYLALTLASQVCFAIELVSTNSFGVQGLATHEPRASAISNDGNAVLFYSSDPTLVPPPVPVNAFHNNYYVKNMLTGLVLEIMKRADGVPLQIGAGDYNFAHMDEPPTRVVFE